VGAPVGQTTAGVRQVPAEAAVAPGRAVGGHRGLSLPHLVVEAFGYRLYLAVVEVLATGLVSAGQRHANVLELSDPTVADQFAHADVGVDRAVLGGGLEYAAGFLHHLTEHPALGHGQGQRLFADDVLAGLGGHDRRDHMPVVWRAVGDHVDVLTVDEFAEVAVGRAGLVVLDAEGLGVMFVHPRPALLASLLVDVADRNDLRIAVAEDLHQVPVDAVVAAADQPVDDPVARGGRPVLTQGGSTHEIGRGYTCGRGPLQKSPTADGSVSGHYEASSLRTGSRAHSVAVFILTGRERRNSLSAGTSQREVARR